MVFLIHLTIPFIQHSISKIIILSFFYILCFSFIGLDYFKNSFLQFSALTITLSALSAKISWYWRNINILILSEVPPYSIHSKYPTTIYKNLHLQSLQRIDFLYERHIIFQSTNIHFKNKLLLIVCHIHEPM